jgi:group II intron reverse transcriptase/maturase
MSLVTPNKVQKLQRALYVKAKSELGYKFYSLYDKVYRPDVMLEAWKRVKKNGGSAGVDGITFEAIEEAGLEKWLRKLEQELRTKTYCPDPLLRVLIPKATDGQRPLSIPSIRDRVAQMCWYLVCVPIYEADLQPQQYGFRPKLDAKMAVRRIYWTVTKGKRTEIVDADLKDYFNTIPHGELLKSLARRTCDKNILGLAKAWLVAPVAERGSKGRISMTTVAKNTHRGSGQGSIVSPLFANLYFRRFILAWQRSEYAAKHHSSIVNYADDFVICCKPGHGEGAMQDMHMLMQKLGLTVNEEKTKIIKLPEEPLDFLGYRFSTKFRKDGSKYLGTKPSPKSVKRVIRKIHDETSRRWLTKTAESRVAVINPILRGWSNYFNQGPVTETYAIVAKYTERRIRRFLAMKHKLPGIGYKQYPDEFLYGKLGFFRLPKTMAEVASAKT